EAFVTAFSPTGASLAFSTLLGGTEGEQASDLALDAAGAIYVTGATSSADFPTTPGAYDTTFNGAGPWDVDAFVAKLVPGASGLVYGTYLGQVCSYTATAIAIDAAGSAYVV